MTTTRRDFMRIAALGVGAFTISRSFPALGQEAPRLVDGVAAALQRLDGLGWRALLLEATGGALDIRAPDLRAELAKPLSDIDRLYPGFGDFALAGSRAIEPGSPDRSLLYHALASPTVVATRSGAVLEGFPTLAEIEAVENYVYGVDPPTMQALRQRAGGRPLGIVVFAPQYQNAPMSVHGRHAELCFSRSGIARLGTLAPSYDARARTFAALDEARPFDFPVMPRRFAPYLAVEMEGASPGFGPQDPQPGDDGRSFWVPLHKLFNGRECIAGLDLDVELRRNLRNDGLAQFHRFLDLAGLENNWRGEDLESFPFVIRDEKIGSFSRASGHGDGLLEPRPGPLVTPAQYEGRLLTFPVDGRYTSDPANLELSSLQVLPIDDDADEPRYMGDAAQDTQRPAPEYTNIRHRVLPNGQIDNLNLRPDMDEIIAAGGYEALHYHDGVGDGWIEALCPALADSVDAVKPAYAMVALPDFFPNVTQRDLMVWWRTEVPEPIRAGLWVIHPLALSQTRIAANVTLPAGFSIEDTTITAIVTQPTEAGSTIQAPNGPWAIRKTGLPDGSPGLFDPGWDTSQGVYYSGPDLTLQKFMAGYGLGSPFIEDAKLCAALGSYWPGVAPDSTRTFAPDKMIGGRSYPYPTVVPLSDEEIGSAPLADGRHMPWDGVHGPRLLAGDKPVVAYPNAYRVDYIDLVGTMTAALTARIDAREYKRRVLAMAAVYWALGIRDPDFVERFGSEEAVNRILREKAAWAVISFRAVAPDDAGVADAERGAGHKLGGDAPRYRFQIYRWGTQTVDPADFNTVHVEVLELATAYVSGSAVLIQRQGEPWQADLSMPT